MFSRMSSSSFVSSDFNVLKIRDKGFGLKPSRHSLAPIIETEPPEFGGRQELLVIQSHQGMNTF